MVCRSILASESGEIDSALFRLTLGVRRGLGKRDTVKQTQTHRMEICSTQFLMVRKDFN